MAVAKNLIVGLKVDNKELAKGLEQGKKKVREFGTYFKVAGSSLGKLNTSQIDQINKALEAAKTSGTTFKSELDKIAKSGENLDKPFKDFLRTAGKLSDVELAGLAPQFSQAGGNASLLPSAALGASAIANLQANQSNLEVVKQLSKLFSVEANGAQDLLTILKLQNSEVQKQKELQIEIVGLQQRAARVVNAEANNRALSKTGIKDSKALLNTITELEGKLENLGLNSSHLSDNIKNLKDEFQGLVDIAVVQQKIPNFLATEEAAIFFQEQLKRVNSEFEQLRKNVGSTDTQAKLLVEQEKQANALVQRIKELKGEVVQLNQTPVEVAPKEIDLSKVKIETPVEIAPKDIDLSKVMIDVPKKSKQKNGTLELIKREVRDLRNYFKGVGKDFADLGRDVSQGIKTGTANGFNAAVDIAKRQAKIIRDEVKESISFLTKNERLAIKRIQTTNGTSSFPVGFRRPQFAQITQGFNDQRIKKAQQATNGLSSGLSSLKDKLVAVNPQIASMAARFGPLAVAAGLVYLKIKLISTAISEFNRLSGEGINRLLTLKTTSENLAIPAEQLAFYFNKAAQAGIPLEKVQDAITEIIAQTQLAIAEDPEGLNKYIAGGITREDLLKLKTSGEALDFFTKRVQELNKESAASAVRFLDEFNLKEIQKLFTDTSRDVQAAELVPQVSKENLDAYAEYGKLTTEITLQLQNISAELALEFAPALRDTANLVKEIINSFKENGGFENIGFAFRFVNKELSKVVSAISTVNQAYTSALKAIGFKEVLPDINKLNDAIPVSADGVDRLGRSVDLLTNSFEKLGTQIDNAFKSLDGGLTNLNLEKFSAQLDSVIKELGKQEFINIDFNEIAKPQKQIELLQETIDKTIKVQKQLQTELATTLDNPKVLEAARAFTGNTQNNVVNDAIEGIISFRGDNSEQARKYVEEWRKQIENQINKTFREKGITLSDRALAESSNLFVKLLDEGNFSQFPDKFKEVFQQIDAGAATQTLDSITASLKTLNEELKLRQFNALFDGLPLKLDEARNRIDQLGQALEQAGDEYLPAYNKQVEEIIKGLVEAGKVDDLNKLLKELNITLQGGVDFEQLINEGSKAKLLKDLEELRAGAEKEMSDLLKPLNDIKTITEQLGDSFGSLGDEVAQSQLEGILDGFTGNIRDLRREVLSINPALAEAFDAQVIKNSQKTLDDLLSGIINDPIEGLKKSFDEIDKEISTIRTAGGIVDFDKISEARKELFKEALSSDADAYKSLLSEFSDPLSRTLIDAAKSELDRENATGPADRVSASGLEFGSSGFANLLGGLLSSTSGRPDIIAIRETGAATRAAIESLEDPLVGLRDSSVKIEVANDDLNKNIKAMVDLLRQELALQRLIADNTNVEEVSI